MAQNILWQLALVFSKITETLHCPTIVLHGFDSFSFGFNDMSVGIKRYETLLTVEYLLTEGSSTMWR